MIGRVLAVCLLVVAVLAAATTAAVTVPISGPYPALHSEFSTSELPPGTPQALQAEPIKRDWNLDYLDDTHWRLELKATSDPSVAASDTFGRQVFKPGDYLEADGDVLLSGNTGSGTASEGDLDTNDSLPPYVSGAAEDLDTLEKDRPSDRFDGPEVAGHETIGWKVVADIACRDVYAECTENAPAAFEALKAGVASQEESWLYDATTGFPVFETKKVANVTVYSYEVSALGFAES